MCRTGTEEMDEFWKEEFKETLMERMMSEFQMMNRYLLGGRLRKAIAGDYSI